jgi:CheY-like chemotaxis protein
MPKILLIEDDLSVQFTLKKLLAFLGNEVDTACNGEEGLIKIQRKTFFDVIICDIDMPTMDGFCFLEKNLKHFTPVTIFIIYFHFGLCRSKHHSKSTNKCRLHHKKAR